MKKIVIIIGILLGVLILGAISIPFLFKDKALALIKDAANKNLEATLDFKDLNISLFRDFPRLSLQLEDLKITGKDKFEGVELVTASSIDVGVNLMDVIASSDKVKIQSIFFNKPFIQAIVLEDSSANYLITKPDTSKAATSSPMTLELQKYGIQDGKIIYDDRVGKMKAVLSGLNHKGSGDLGAAVTELKTTTTIDSLDFINGGIKLLNKARIDADVTLKAELAIDKYTLNKNTIKINDLPLQLDGWVQLYEKYMNMDFTFSSPGGEFKQLFSLIPGAYSSSFEGVKSSGTFKLNGSLKGKYDGTNSIYPAINIQASAANGNIQYPKMPMGISEVNMDMETKFPGGGNLDLLTVDVPKLHFKLGNNPMDIVFHLKTPISDPNVDARAKGSLKLDDIAQAFPMEQTQGLNGLLNADVTVKALQSQIEKKMYEQVQCKGQIHLSGMNYKAKGQPNVKIADLAMQFSPQSIQVNNINAQLGKSDVNGNGRIDNFLAYFSPKKTMSGQFFLRSNLLDMNEWVSAEPQKATPQTDAPAANAQRPFDRFDFSLDGAASKIIYDKYILNDVVTKGRMTSSRLDMNNFGMNIGNSDINGNGYLSNLFGYLFDNETLKGEINIKSKLMDLNQFMEPASTASKEQTPAGTVAVPKNVAVRVNANMDKVLYTNMTLSQNKGSLAIQNEEVRIEDMTTNTLGGTVKMVGAYSSAGAGKPKFNFKYDISNMNFKESFHTLNTVKSIAPIAQFMDGKFNTSMALEGKLGEGMIPDFNTLSGAGFLQTIAGAIKNFKPIQEVAKMANVKELENIDLKETKNWFEIVNGAVEVKEFDKTIKDIALKIGGRHSLSNEMDYNIKAKIPRKLFDQNGLGVVNNGLNALSGQASKLGLNINAGEFVNVLFNLKGSMLSPKVSMKLLGTEGKGVAETAKDELKNQANKAIDSLKTVAQKEADKYKEQAKKEANKVIDSAKTVIKQKTDEVVDKAQKEVKDKIGEKAGEILDKTVGDKAKEIGGEKAKQEADKLKEKLEKWNPFGGKKKEGGK